MFGNLKKNTFSPIYFNPLFFNMPKKYAVEEEMDESELKAVKLPKMPNNYFKVVIWSIVHFAAMILEIVAVVVIGI